jgi:hypothetical protein
MSEKKETTVVFTIECVERCGVLPDIRYDDAGAIEVFIPAATDVSQQGEWVKATITEAHDIVTLSCDATSDGFKAIYMAPVERYREAWQPEKRHCTRIDGVPRQCGPCGDSIDNFTYQLETDNDHLAIQTEGGNYQFKQDASYGAESITPEMVKLVTTFVDSHALHDTSEESFFALLKRALTE